MTHWRVYGGGRTVSLRTGSILTYTPWLYATAAGLGAPCSSRESSKPAERDAINAYLASSTSRQSD